MDYYPAELVSPPLVLVALLGQSDIQPALQEYFRSHQRPPINTVGLANPLAAAGLFGECTRGMLDHLVNLSNDSALKFTTLSHSRKQPACVVLHQSKLCAEKGLMTRQ